MPHHSGPSLLRARHRALFVGALLLLVQCSVNVGAQESLAPADIVLGLNQPVQQSIKPKETLTYSVRVSKDYFVQVMVETKSIDVSISLQPPNGKPTTRLQENMGTGGSESLLMITDEAGLVRLQITGQRSSSEGTCSVRLQSLRPVRQGDRDRVTADELLWEALLFARQSTRESRNSAIEKLREAIPLLERVHDKPRLGVVFNRIGRNYNLLGNRDLAIENYQKSLDIRRETNDTVGEALVLSDMGFCYSLAGEFQKALDYQTRSLNIRRALKDRRLESQALFLIGNVYTQLGEPEKALSYFAEALPVVRASGQKFSEARVLNQMSAAYLSLGQLDQALAALDECLELQRASSNRVVIRNVLWHKAMVYFRMGQLPKAREFFDQALELELQHGDPYDLGNIYVGLGEVHYQLGNREKARSLLEQSLALMRTTHNLPGQARVHYLLARIEGDSQRLNEARSEIEAAISIVEGVRSALVAQELRASYFATVERYYDFYVEILWQLHGKQPQEGFSEKALLVSERARARSLVELLNEGKIDIRQGVSGELLARERELQTQLNAKAAAQPLLVSERATKEQTAANTKEIDEISRALLDVEGQIRKQSPHYAALTQPQTLQLKEIQGLLDEDTILLEYKLGEPRSFLWAISRNGFHALALAGRSQIEPLARRYYRLLNSQHSSNDKESTDGDYSQVAESLSRLLLGPIAPDLKTQRLLIVSDGALQYIPFAALPGPENKQALIFNHEVVSLPSASVIAVLRQETATRTAAAKALAVFADPVFAKDDVRVATAQRRKVGPRRTTRDIGSDLFAAHLAGKTEKTENETPAITRLPFSRREANAIMAYAPASETYAALDFEANRTNATRADLLNYRIVHFATHGWLNSHRPELSGVVLSLVNQKGEPQDGVLRLHEIYNLQLNADLVVLSACQTALGKEVRGEGLIGLTRGIMYAGAPRVAASLWKVDDAATAELMDHFYRFMLKEKLPPAAALRAAQLELIKQKRWHSPYFWAGFVLQGEWR